MIREKTKMNRIVMEIVRVPMVIVWWLMGWHLNRKMLEEDKIVLTGAPHTTNWDYMHFLFSAITLRRKIYVTVKKELFFFPLGFILKALGGIPVDRHNSSNLVQDLAERLKESKRMVLLFTPDGTRSYKPYWKTGFYWVAKQANVPIILGICDYEKKIVYLDYELIPSGDVEADFEKIREQQDKYGVALYPEKANPVITRKAYEAQLMDVETDISALERLADEEEMQEELSA